MRSARLNSRGLTAVLGVLAAFCLLAGSAQAATYPAGGGAFNNDAEGWHTVGEPTCTLPLSLLCESSGEFEGGAGNPPGSLAAKTKVIANLLGLFKATVDFQSPNFTASEGGAAQLHLERELVSTSALDLTPSATYAVSLLDRSNGGSSKVIEGSASGSVAGFAADNGSATLVPGHVYAIGIETETTSSVANLGLLGSTALRFDNVAVTTVGGGGGGGNGGNGGSGGAGGAGARGSGAGNGALSSARLLSLFRAGSSAAPVTVKGNRLFAKVSCPPRIGRACHIVARGMLNRHTAATAKRTVKVGKGKGKQIVLRIKPGARKQVAKRKRLLVREAVSAGKARATIFQSRKLIRR